MPSARAHPAAQLPAALLIDDHDDTREMYRLALSDAGFRVFEAGNGLDGAVCASDALPDVIVTELAMPCLDGFELIARLHHDVRTTEIPVIVLSAWADAITRERARTSGAAAFLLKPCLPDALLSAIDRTLHDSPRRNCSRPDRAATE